MLVQKLTCAFLLGEAKGNAAARKIAESYRNCPYVYFMATREKELFAAFFLPEEQRWWIEYVEKKPRETFGLEKAKVTFMDIVNYPNKLRMRLPKRKGKISPCGSDCGSDPLYEKGRCLGCPATVYYKHKHQ